MYNSFMNLASLLISIFSLVASLIIFIWSSMDAKKNREKVSGVINDSLKDIKKWNQDTQQNILKSLLIEQLLKHKSEMEKLAKELDSKFSNGNHKIGTLTFDQLESMVKVVREYDFLSSFVEASATSADLKKLFIGYFAFLKAMLDKIQINSDELSLKIFNFNLLISFLIKETMSIMDGNEPIISFQNTKESFVSVFDAGGLIVRLTIWTENDQIVDFDYSYSSIA